MRRKGSAGPCVVLILLRGRRPAIPQDFSLGLTPPCSSALASMVLYVARGPDAVETLNGRNLSYSEVACVAVLTWDVLVTLTEEVRSVAV